MQITSDQAIFTYADVYERLYKRTPRELRAIDQEWVIVNGAHMRAGELDYLTRQLEQEYDQSVAYKRNMIKRLMNFFKQ